MKKLIIPIAIFMIIQIHAKAQDSVKTNLPIPKHEIQGTTNLKQNSWFFELGGASAGLTINYERFLSKKPGGLSLRAGFGAGIIAFGDVIAYGSLPLGASYNIPISKNKNHFIEVGGTYTFIAGGLLGVEDGTGSFGFISPQIGWRYFSTQSGFQMRVTLIPFVSSPVLDGPIGPFAGISLGKRF